MRASGTRSSAASTISARPSGEREFAQHVLDAAERIVGGLIAQSAGSRAIDGASCSAPGLAGEQLGGNLQIIGCVDRRKGRGQVGRHDGFPRGYLYVMTVAQWVKEDQCINAKQSRTTTSSPEQKHERTRRLIGRTQFPKMSGKPHSRIASESAAVDSALALDLEVFRRGLASIGDLFIFTARPLLV